MSTDTDCRTLRTVPARCRPGLQSIGTDPVERPEWISGSVEQDQRGTDFLHTDEFRLLSPNRSGAAEPSPGGGRDATVSAREGRDLLVARQRHSLSRTRHQAAFGKAACHRAERASLGPLGCIDIRIPRHDNVDLLGEQGPEGRRHADKRLGRCPRRPVPQTGYLSHLPMRWIRTRDRDLGMRCPSYGEGDGVRSVSSTSLAGG